MQGRVTKAPIKTEENEVKQYIHEDKKRTNNPPIGLVKAETDSASGKKVYKFDPHLDPQLQWASKAEGLSFNIDTISLHVHERIDPLTIIEGVRSWEYHVQKHLFHYFETKENNPSYRDALEFYKHSQGWSNRLIAGDSLLVMNSLLEKEGMGGKVQMVYIDPPYGIRYGSNFQPFVDKRDVQDGKDEDLTKEPEMLKAFRDTWELGIHSYLTYLRNRLLLARELLNESGSCFVQISDENLHHVREIMDEIFDRSNFIAQIIFKKTGSMSGNFVSGIYDIILWYGKDKKKTKFNKLYVNRSIESVNSGFPFIELQNGEVRRLSEDEFELRASLPKGRRFQTSPLMSAGESKEGSKPFIFNGKQYSPSRGNHWKVSAENLEKLARSGRLLAIGNTLTFKKYLDEAPYTPLSNAWLDTMESTFAVKRLYVVQTAVSND